MKDDEVSQYDIEKAGNIFGEISMAAENIIGLSNKIIEADPANHEVCMLASSLEALTQKVGWLAHQGIEVMPGGYLTRLNAEDWFISNKKEVVSQ